MELGFIGYEVRFDELICQIHRLANYISQFSAA